MRKIANPQDDAAMVNDWHFRIQPKFILVNSPSFGAGNLPQTF